jgi:Coenzyme PQQ synthesis protein D (PqqD)
MSAVTSTRKHGKLRCADAVHSRLFDEELVILDLAKGEYFALDPLGARLWSGLEAGRTVEQVAQEIVAEYDVALDHAVADLTALRDDLVARGLMVRDDA